MQNDLISKQSVIEKIWELYNSYGNDAEVYDELTTEAINREFSRLQRAIENMKTAYDVEKVIAELKENSKIYCEEYHQREGSLYIQDVVQIVRSGGKE